MRELQRIEEEFFRPAGRVWPAIERGYPLFNVWTNGDGTIVTAELPGLDVANVDISVHGDALTIRGARSAEELKEGEAYYRQERPYGEFSRTLKLPFRVDAEKVSATMSKGLLSITLPRAAADKPYKLAIKAE